MRRLLTLALIGALLAGCGSDSAPTGDGENPQPGTDPVTVLARIDGWLEQSVEFVQVEIAPDEAAARAAWDEHVGDELPEGTGDPVVAGVYADIDAVDFEQQALVVFSSGGSGSCPPWVTDLVTEGERLEVTLDRQAATACTDDFNPYRLLLAVDRDRLPAPEGPPITRIDVPSENLTDVAGRVRFMASDDARSPEEVRAEQLLGVAEDELDTGADLRVVRRGDEQFMVTMDVRPGRLNVELDPDGEGVFRVTRVEIETGDAPIVVE